MQFEGFCPPHGAPARSGPDGLLTVVRPENATGSVSLGWSAIDSGGSVVRSELRQTRCHWAGAPLTLDLSVVRGGACSCRGPMAAN